MVLLASGRNLDTFFKTEWSGQEVKRWIMITGTREQYGKKQIFSQQRNSYPAE